MENCIQTRYDQKDGFFMTIAILSIFSIRFHYVIHLTIHIINFHVIK